MNPPTNNWRQRPTEHRFFCSSGTIHDFAVFISSLLGLVLLARQFFYM
jgi:hypothetical protein